MREPKNDTKSNIFKRKKAKRRNITYDPKVHNRLRKLKVKAERIYLPEAGNKAIYIRGLDNEVHSRFKAACSARGMSMTESIYMLMCQFADEVLGETPGMYDD